MEGRCSDHYIEGEMTYNGCPMPMTFHKRDCFICQKESGSFKDIPKRKYKDIVHELHTNISKSFDKVFLETKINNQRQEYDLLSSLYTDIYILRGSPRYTDDRSFE